MNEREKVRRYAGKALTVKYEVKRCIHVEECVRSLPQVFDRDGRPWIVPDGASADEVTDVILRCPTGALKFERHDGGDEEPVPETNTITVEGDGPLYARGDIEVVARDGSVLRDTRIAFCRCGASANKPFCDGAHSEIGFKDSGALGRSGLKAEGAVERTSLRVSLAPNGPLLLEGPVEIVAAVGGARASGVKGALCRCGASQNKPYCDGSHKRVGFSSEAP